MAIASGTATGAPSANVAVERDDLVHGYEFAKDQYVRFTEAELQTLEPKPTKASILRSLCRYPGSIRFTLKAPSISVRMKVERNLTGC